MSANAELQLYRDYANTWKHFRRDRNGRVAYIWEDGDLANGGQYVTIAHRLLDDLESTQTLVDGLALAWAAWLVFMSSNGLAEPTGWTQPYPDKLLAREQKSLPPQEPAFAALTPLDQGWISSLPRCPQGNPLRRGRAHAGLQSS